MKNILFSFFLVLLISACRNESFKADKYLDYCVHKGDRTLAELKGYNQMPRTIAANARHWNSVDVDDWTSGFWPGTLWYLYEYTHDEKYRIKADSFTVALQPVVNHKAMDHDLGFMIYLSYGNGYRLTKNPLYKETVLKASKLLSELYNPKVGTILSWPGMVTKMRWPHNTIIDNMMNLEMLFWASQNSENKSLYQIADNHAQTTSKNQFRPDFSCYHVVVYDTLTGKKIKGVTHQGYSDSSMWARGQAWAIYGFTMCYRETRRTGYLDLAENAADVYLKRLPEDAVPYWDFDAPGIPNAPKDASAAGIAASALLELSVLNTDNAVAAKYFGAALRMLKSLSSDGYLSRSANPAFLLHSTGHKPNNSEIDASIIYADYYYLEALIRLKKIQEGKSIYENL
jgi:unsaturated chondroitin disaccharide hydrolase